MYRRIEMLKDGGDETWRVKMSRCQISANVFRIDMVRKSQTRRDPTAEKDQHPRGETQPAALDPICQFYSENMYVNLL